MSETLVKKQIPRVIISAPSSGSGKTMVTCGLLNLFKNRYSNVRAFKCGPDYIDPLFHKTVLGISSENLDSFFSKDDYLIRQLCDAEGAYTIIEGVMGLYDGLGGILEEGSAYNLASITKTPIVLVIDAHGMGQTLVSLIKGLLSDDINHLIKGVILNRTSKSFFETIAPMIENTGIKALGFVPVIKDISIPNRHLGLMLPDEIPNVHEKIDIISNKLNETVDIQALSEIMRAAECLMPVDSTLDDKKDKDILGKTASDDENDIFFSDITIAVAKDEAFCFIYDANIRLLLNCGCKIVYFSPIHDKHLPNGISGIYLPGGYPENFLEALSDNISMKEDIATAWADKMPILAECGGFMYLHEKIVDTEGAAFSMCGAYEGLCEYKNRLVRFGYIDITFDNGMLVKGHEFHYYDSDNNGLDARAVKPVSGKKWECMYADIEHGQIVGFPHLYWPSNPDFVSCFLRACNKFGEK